MTILTKMWASFSTVVLFVEAFVQMGLFPAFRELAYIPAIQNSIK